mmetsp:Transcript_35879/g.83668  ORF Transcript_35879/g.83668 Transcript_35879/m.83668 type:complete len:204 (+) Transcript_35879:269-880(+)
MTRSVLGTLIFSITAAVMIPSSCGFANYQFAKHVRSKSAKHRSQFVLHERRFSREDFMKTMVVGLGSLTSLPPSSFAMPSLTVREFSVILKDSYKSVKTVEFFGSSGDRATVTLLDGTTFSISDLYESPSDPRSPLKLAAVCREYGINTKFQLLESLAKKDGRNKVYMNSRVAEAAVKQEAKKQRMALDEAQRLEAVELYEAE